jgi:hypothetical protein
MCSAHPTSRHCPGECRVGGHTLLEGVVIPFEGCGVEEGRERVAQYQGMMPATTHSTRTMSVMAAQRRAVRTVSRPDSQAASGDRRGGDLPFDPGARGVSGHLMLRSGE